MIITSNGHHSIKLQTGDVVFAINPISKESSLKSTKFGADVALVSINHPDFNGASDMTFGEKVPFVINTPGEFEVKGTFIKGFLSESTYNDGEYVNTVFSVNMDGLHVCILGALSNTKLSDEAHESLIDIDILFIPLSKDTLKSNDAHKLAVSLEPHMIIPLGDEEEIKLFVKEAGGKKPEEFEKLTLKKKDVEGKVAEIVLLTN